MPAISIRFALRKPRPTNLNSKPAFAGTCGLSGGAMTRICRQLRLSTGAEWISAGVGGSSPPRHTNRFPVRPSHTRGRTTSTMLAATYHATRCQNIRPLGSLSQRPIGRPEEALWIGAHERLLRASGAASQTARRSSWWWSAVVALAACGSRPTGVSGGDYQSPGSPPVRNRHASHIASLISTNFATTSVLASS